MNVESLKSELQQVLDNDLVLRKEFTDLKRSLSDYRNQLIVRDEDCKRLQVTIDVLNTKLLVVERDNNNYKAELTSFKELRGTIKEQLQAKQDEIETRLAEIQGLKDDLNSIAADYEQKMEEMRAEAGAELERVNQQHEKEIVDLKALSQWRESNLKEELENRIFELTGNILQTEQALTSTHALELARLTDQYENEIESLKSEYNAQLLNLSSGSKDDVNAMIETHQNTLSAMETAHDTKVQTIEQSYKTEISNLRSALEEQRSTLTNNFNSQIEHIKNESVNRQNFLTESFQKQIDELNTLLSNSTRELSESYQAEMNALKSSHFTAINETNSAHDARVASLVSEYEEKLSHTLIHSNSQNSKLHEELGKVQADSESSMEQIRELTVNLETRILEISDLTSRISDLDIQLKNETLNYSGLNAEFEAFKQNAALSTTEQVSELNNQLAALNLSHSDYANELNSKIESLNEELKNMVVVFEKTSNSLSEAETARDIKTQDLLVAEQRIAELQETIQVHDAELENMKLHANESLREELKSKELEFNKLLAENSNIINEIDIAQDKVEALEEELRMLTGELDEVKTISAGKTSDFKETIANKNFEITNLEANNAALVQELLLLKEENARLSHQVVAQEEAGNQVNSLQQNFEVVNSEKENLANEISNLNTTITALNENTIILTEKIASYEAELESLKTSDRTEEQDAFIDRLFKQIDHLNDQRMALLNEKEQMAAQLLKMNEVVGSISQQVDSEQIDVSGLNNHRKNVILATNSGEVHDKSQMKEQINDLVREIDKCIALLSA